MAIIATFLFSILGVGGTGAATPSDGTGGSGHGAVFDASGPAPSDTHPEYSVGCCGG